MSTGNAMSDRPDEVLDASAAESDAGKLEDAEIQRLVALSRDASYRPTERVPVKSIEAFEPRSLVSIAMAAQRRREEDMSFDAAAAAATAADKDVSSDALAAEGDQSTDAAATDMVAAGLVADQFRRNCCTVRCAERDEVAAANRNRRLQQQRGGARAGLSATA